MRVLGPNHRQTLITRNIVALWTGENGIGEKALRLSEALLPDMEQALGTDHPFTLTVRSNIGSWAGDCGYSEQAFRLFQALLPDAERVLGADHPETLTVRNNMAVEVDRVWEYSRSTAPIPAVAARYKTSGRHRSPADLFNSDPHRKPDLLIAGIRRRLCVWLETPSSLTSSGCSDQITPAPSSLEATLRDGPGNAVTPRRRCVYSILCLSTRRGH